LVPEPPPEPLPLVADAVALGEEEAPLDEEVLCDGLGVLEGLGLVDALVDGLVDRLGVLEALCRADGLLPVEALRDAVEAAGLSEDPEPRLTA
jgi:hypothetical protein